MSENTKSSVVSLTASSATTSVTDLPAISTVFSTLENYLGANPPVFGAALAFNPEVLNASPFVFRGENGFEQTNIADAIDYTQAVWYKIPVEQGQAVWSVPYFDVGGAGEDVALTTYSIPVFDASSKLVGIVTNDLLLASIDNLAGQQATIKTALSDFAVSFNPDQNSDGILNNEDVGGIFNNLKTYLGKYPTVFGSAFAFNPEVFNASPFVFRGENGLEQTDIADAIDYSNAVWYEVPVEQGEALWSRPYFDVGGAGEDVLLTTYSIPIFDRANSNLVGVLTSDLLLGSFAPGEIETQRQVIKSTAVGLAQDISLNLLDIPFTVPIKNAGFEEPVLPDLSSSPSNLTTDELVSFELKDIVIPAQSGVANVTVNLDYKAGVDNTQFRNIIPVAEFVKDSLKNSQNPNEFYEVINRNVTTSLLNNSSFDFTSVLDSASVKLDVAPNASIPFAFSNTIALTPDGTTDALVSFELKDVVIPAQSGLANVSVTLDYKAGVDNTQFRNIIPVAEFVKDGLTNSQNPNEFYEVINKNVAEQTFSDLGLASDLDSLTITLGVTPNSGIPFPFANTVTVTPNGITQCHGDNLLALNSVAAGI